MVFYKVKRVYICHFIPRMKTSWPPLLPTHAGFPLQGWPSPLVHNHSKGAYVWTQLAGIRAPGLSDGAHRCWQRCLEVSDGGVQELSPQSPVSTSISGLSVAGELKGMQLTSGKSLSDSKFAGGHNSARCLWAVPAGLFLRPE